MKRRWFLAEGIICVVGSVAALLAFGLAAPSLVLLCTGFGLTGVCLIFAGTNEELRGVKWYQFHGISTVVIGAILLLVNIVPIMTSGSPYESLGATVFVSVAAILSGAFLIFMGIDWFRGGVHLNLTTYEKGPIFASGR
jgi:energy-converting hydrogenase Eha subunit E